MKSVSLLCTALLITLVSFSQTVKFSGNNGVAINGFDPVAYFTLQKALEGNSNYSYEWSGSIWKFVSKDNLNLFQANPENYAPQFGGYCAYGCSEKHLSPTDPKAFTIINDKLYLNYNQKVKEVWIKDTANRIQTANQYWKSIYNN
jgi:YHS domain-containing protein